MFTEKEIKYIWCCMNHEQTSSEEMLVKHYDGRHELEHDDLMAQIDAIQLNNKIRKKCEMLSKGIPPKPDYLDM